MKNSSKTITILLFGVATGAALSLLLTSKNGEKACGKIIESVRNLCSSIKKNGAAANDQLQSKVKEAVSSSDTEEANSQPV